MRPIGFIQRRTGFPFAHVQAISIDTSNPPARCQVCTGHAICALTRVGVYEKRNLSVFPYHARPTCFPHTFYNFDDGFDIPPTEGARCRSSNTRCVYPGFEHRKGRLRYSTCSNRSRFRGHPPDYDSGTLPSLLRKEERLAHIYLGHHGKLQRLR